MMYPYLTLEDETEMVHSQIIKAHLIYKYAKNGGIKIA